MENKTKLSKKEIESSKTIELKEGLNGDYYEEVTVNVPKQIMDLLRFAESINEITPIEQLEHFIIDSTRAALDSGEFLPTAQELAERFKLNPIFEATGDMPIQ